MIYSLLFLFCLVFVELFIFLKIMKDIQSILQLAREGMGVLSSSEMSDEEKERSIRRKSLELFAANFIFIAKFLLILLVLYGAYFSINKISMEMGKSIVAGYKSIPVLFALTVLTMFYVWIRNSFAQNYSVVDRLLHYIAFSFPFVQKILCELENDIYKRQIKAFDSQRQVFVTGLPRAGTTLVLELLYGTGEFATFIYRNMPFVLSPLIWEKVSKPFYKQATTMERAHGDGMEISFDSPEAFEEVIWQTYLKNKIVNKESLSPLFPGDETNDFVDAFRAVVKKIQINNSSWMNQDPCHRYLSKNNTNISRIELICTLFPSSTILIPFRNPLAHVSSLLKQHKQFSAYHKDDKFSQRYMRWLGHYDFGLNLKPIDFDNWLGNIEIKSYEDENFWMNYWIAAYKHVLKHKTDNVCLIDFDKLLHDGVTSLQSIADRLGLDNKNELIKTASTLRSPTTHPLESNQFSQEILIVASDIYEQLKSKAI